MLNDSSRLLIQKKILENYGLNVKVYQKEDTGDIYVKRVARVSRKPVGLNQIELLDAQVVDPKAKVGQYVELDFDDNVMLNEIVSDCISTTARAEEVASIKSNILESLKAKGIIYYSLIFAKFEQKTLMGDAIFKLDNIYEVVIDKDKLMEGDEFEVGKDYPMIIISFNITTESNNKLTIKASRITSNLVEELLRYSLANCNYNVEIKSICREAGVLSKVIVDIPDLNNETLNPAGIVIGPKGSTIKEVEKYLPNEKVEIINYSRTTPGQIRNIVGPNEVLDMFFYFQNPEYFKEYKFFSTKKVIVVVRDQNIGRIIGKNGVSLKLTNRLCGWSVQIVSETDYTVKYPHGFVDLSSDDFDWYGQEIDPYLAKFYGHYLKQNRVENIAELQNLTKDDLDIKEFSDSDKEVLLDFVKEINFDFTCPTCGKLIDYYSTSCPYCGEKFEE